MPVASSGFGGLGDFFGGVGDFFGSLSPKDTNSFWTPDTANTLVGLGSVGADIFNNYDQNRYRDSQLGFYRDKQASDDRFNQLRLDQDSRQFNELLGFRNQELAANSELKKAAIMAKIKMRRGELIDKAYENMALLARQGRLDEAKQLGKLIVSLQNAFLKPGGARG